MLQQPYHLVDVCFIYYILHVCREHTGVTCKQDAPQTPKQACVCLLFNIIAGGFEHVNGLATQILKLLQIWSRCSD